MEAESCIEFSVVVIATAGQARDHAPDGSDPPEIEPALRTSIMIARAPALDLEGERVTARLAGDVQVDAGLAPLCAVRGDAPATGPKLGKQMGELMTQRSVDFGRSMLTESRIEGDERTRRVSPSGACAEAGIPFDADLIGDGKCAEGAQQLARRPLQLIIPAALLPLDRRRIVFPRIENQLKLPKQQHKSAWLLCEPDDARSE